MSDNTPSPTAVEMHAWNLMCEEHTSWMFQDFESTFRDKYKRAEGGRSKAITPMEAYQFILNWCARTVTYEEKKVKELEDFLDYTKAHKEYTVNV